jgi:hypothetical protein
MPPESLMTVVHFVIFPVKKGMQHLAIMLEVGCVCLKKEKNNWCVFKMDLGT